VLEKDDVLDQDIIFYWYSLSLSNKKDCRKYSILEDLNILSKSNTLPLNPPMESSIVQNMEEVVKFTMELKKKVICSGRAISLSSDLNFPRGVVSRDSPNVQSYESIHFVDRENPIGGGNNRLTLGTSIGEKGISLPSMSKEGANPSSFTIF